MQRAPPSERVAILLLSVMLAVGRLEAQAPTGKIDGGVRSPDGSPLVEAQVYIVGTTYSALTDPRGHYFINNIPAGTIAMRVVLIGHRPVELRNLRVMAGQTITQDFVLEPAPVQLQELTTVIAENPLVPRDEVTTKQRVNGEFADELPVDRLRGLLALQPGVVAGVDDDGRGSPPLSIRGGRPDEAVTYIDGVPVTPGYRSVGYGDPPGTEISVGSNGVEEASLTTGAASAEFGNALSGVVSIQTRTGDQLTGSLAYETDEPFGVNHSLGFNRLQATLSVPVARHLSLFFSGVLEGQQSARTGFDAEKAPIFVSAGVDTTVAVPSEAGNPFADTSSCPGVPIGHLPGRVRRIRGQRQRGDPHQLWYRLPGHPHAVERCLELRASGQAELHLWSGVPGRAELPGQSKPGACLRLLQLCTTRRIRRAGATGATS